MLTLSGSDGGSTLAWRILYDRFGVAEVLRGGDPVATGGYQLVIEEEIPPAFASRAVDGTSKRARRARGILDLDSRTILSAVPTPGPITLRLNSKDVVSVDVQIFLPEQWVLDFICIDPATIERLLAPTPTLNRQTASNRA